MAAAIEPLVFFDRKQLRDELRVLMQQGLDNAMRPESMTDDMLLELNNTLATVHKSTLTLEIQTTDDGQMRSRICVMRKAIS